MFEADFLGHQREGEIGFGQQLPGAIEAHAEDFLFGGTPRDDAGRFNEDGLRWRLLAGHQPKTG